MADRSRGCGEPSSAPADRPCPRGLRANCEGTIPDTLNEIAQSSPGQKAGDVSLVTRNHNLKELALELSRIYLTLYNSKRLSVKSVETSEHTVEAVLRKERLFYGKFFPTEIDSMICDLNSDICNRERTEATGEQRQSLTSNVSGFLPSETRWRLEPPVNKLWVPDVVLVKDTGWLPYDVMPKTQLAPLVIDELGGCEKFDETCQKLIIFTIRRLAEGSSRRHLRAGWCCLC